jgi:hypothetical protein
MKTIIHDVSTNEITEVEMTKAEIAKIKADELQLQNQISEMEEQENAKAALLTRLGISADEAKLLLI